MHWVYVLRSSRGGIYIGETVRLFRRWNEHQTGRGGINTSQGDFDTIIGLYSVVNNRSFVRFLDDGAIWRCERYWDDETEKQEALTIENHITERYLSERGISHNNIRGGKYTTEDRCENFCFGGGKCIKDRPLCKCGYPCEVKMKNDKTKIYFVCPIPDWIKGFKVPEKCNFWQEYEPYRIKREELQKPKKVDFNVLFPPE
jgi:predicted GIY-YIG superfamily endonuclease